MNKIFFDIGNSYVKWATIVDGYYETYEPVVMQALLDEGLDTLGVDIVFDTVYFSSVAKSAKVDEFKSLIQQQWKLIAIQLTSQQSCCGLVSGYTDFSKLGDDRWLAMLGAIEVYKQPVLVIDAGTALTIDAIVDGKHQGGFIVPGLHTMRKSLFMETADLEDYSQQHQAKQNMPIATSLETEILASDTSSAILGGTLYMMAAFVNQVILDLNHQLNTQFKVIVTGGEAKQIMPLMDGDFDFIPDLVLQGMVFVEESVKKH